MTRDTHPVASIAVAVLMATSIIVGVAIVGTQPFGDAAHDGTAAAAEAPSQLFNYTEHTEDVEDVAVDESTGTGFSVADDTELHAWDASDGSQKWTYTQFGGNVYAVAVDESRGVVYAAGTDNEVHAVNIADGSQKWVNTDSASNIDDLAVNESSGFVYAASSWGLQGINESGSREWFHDAYSDYAAVAVDESAGTVYTGGSDNEVHAIDISTQNTNWNYTGHSNAITGVGVNESSKGVFSTSTDNSVHGINSDGSQSWSVSKTYTMYDVAINQDAGEVYAAGNQSQVFALNQTDGSENWVYDGHDLPPYGVAFDESTGNVYSGGNDHFVHGYSPNPGDAVSGDVEGLVLDQNGDPVANATVYATGIDTVNPPKIGTRGLDKVLSNPVPSSWLDQLRDMDGFSRDEFTPDDAGLDGTHVFLHNEDDWSVGSIPNEYVVSDRIFEGTPPSDIRPRPVVDPDNGIILACWEPSGSGFLTSDSIDQSIPGYETTNCGSIVIERVDPLDDTTAKRTLQVEPLYTVWDPRNLGSKEHYVAATDLPTGMYTVYPEGEKGNAMTYAVAPDGDVDRLEADIENYASQNYSGGSQFDDELKSLFDDNEIEAPRTTTNSSGYYGITFNNPSQIDTADIRAVKAGGEIDVSREDLTRSRLRSDYEQVVSSNFRAHPDVSQSPEAFLDENGRDEFRSVCSEMDSVLDDVGESYYGDTTTSVPNDAANIDGTRLIPEGTDPLLSECAAVNIAEQIANDPLSVLPGFAGDLSGYARSELNALYTDLYAFISANDDIHENVEDEYDGGELPEDPTTVPRGDLEDIIDDGLGEVDSPSGGTDTDYGGGGSGGIGGSVPGTGGGDAPVVDDPEETQDRVNETISRSWPVSGVDDWDDTGLLIRIVFSDGTEDVLGPESEYVSIEENTIGTDRVHLEEYPFNASDAAVARISIDVATNDGLGRDRGSARNPTFDGHVPGLQSIRVSKMAPGPSDLVTVSASPEDRVRWGGVSWVNVTGPDCTRNNQAEDDEVTFETCGSGVHRIEVTFLNDADSPDRFTEVLRVEAQPTSQGRPPAVRAAAGPSGRYAVVGNGLSDGRIEVTNGASEVVLTGIVPADSDVPTQVVASTTGVDVARDATTEVRIRKGTTEQTIRQRVGILLHTDRVGEDSLLYRNGRPIPNPGDHPDATVEHRDQSTSLDTFSGETASVRVEVSRNPGIVERVIHGIRLRFPSLPGTIAMVLFIGRPKRRRPTAALNGTQEAEA